MSTWRTPAFLMLLMSNQIVLMRRRPLVEVLGDGFMKYMDAFKPFLLIGHTKEMQNTVFPVKYFTLSARQHFMAT